MNKPTPLPTILLGLALALVLAPTVAAQDADPAGAGFLGRFSSLDPTLAGTSELVVAHPITAAEQGRMTIEVEFGPEAPDMYQLRVRTTRRNAGTSSTHTVNAVIDRACNTRRSTQRTEVRAAGRGDVATHTVELAGTTYNHRIETTGRPTKNFALPLKPGFMTGGADLVLVMLLGSHAAPGRYGFVGHELENAHTVRYTVGPVGAEGPGLVLVTVQPSRGPRQMFVCQKSNGRIVEIRYEGADVQIAIPSRLQRG